MLDTRELFNLIEENFGKLVARIVLFASVVAIVCTGITAAGAVTLGTYKYLIQPTLAKLPAMQSLEGWLPRTVVSGAIALGVFAFTFWRINRLATRLANYLSDYSVDVNEQFQRLLDRSAGLDSTNDALRQLDERIHRLEMRTNQSLNTQTDFILAALEHPSPRVRPVGDEAVVPEVAERFSDQDASP